MYEIKYVRQRPGEPLCRWFMDDYWDLFIWTGDDGEFTSFQLCYGKPWGERALDWNADGSYRHARVSESGHNLGGGMDTPLLVQDGLFNVETTADRFLKDSEDIDQKVRDFVHEKILEYTQ